ncbi:MAG: exosortase A, partial [Gammaproteobacteria bacterium]|nr:exosortase A [Gammaproteobacteria bacterium]
MRMPQDMALPTSRTALSTAFAIGGLTLTLLLMYLPTVSSMVSIWFQSNTFTHCLFIAPMALFMVYDSRREFAGLPVAPAFAPVAGVAAAGLIWLASRLASIQVTEHLSLVAMLVFSVYALLGTAITRRIAYPLAFLFLAVPFGEGLIPHLIEFTGNFSAAAIRWSGVPVFHEGNQIILPTGNWSVVTACSGIRYLLATVTIAAVYGYFSYRSIWRRLVFIALGVLVAVLANGIRAYGIMMIGHLSNMRLAVGVDHILYGWLFFGI